MGENRISRREAARQFFLMSAAIAAPTWLATACGKKEFVCTDTAGLTPVEVTTRTQTLAYADKSAEPAKTCAKCQLFKPAGDGCGTCTVIKGPINPGGSCKSFAPKVA
jgi:hypothetical protein